VGFSPSEGLVSRQGIIPISITYDRAGPMARSVTDAAIVMSVMAGTDVSTRRDCVIQLSTSTHVG
jgi:amidase